MSTSHTTGDLTDMSIVSDTPARRIRHKFSFSSLEINASDNDSFVPVARAPNPPQQDIKLPKGASSLSLASMTNTDAKIPTEGRLKDAAALSHYSSPTFVQDLAARFGKKPGRKVAAKIKMKFKPPSSKASRSKREASIAGILTTEVQNGSIVPKGPLQIAKPMARHRLLEHLHSLDIKRLKSKMRPGSRE